MCGGRDFDLILFDSVVKPWLRSKFDLPDDFSSADQFKSLRRMAVWAVEKAKIELSQKDHAAISLPETELGVKDMSGEEIYLDIVRRQRSLDRTGGLKKGEFLAHRNVHRSEDETANSITERPG